MKHTLFTAALSLLSPVAMVAQGVADTPPNYHLVWSDEFNGTELNENNWTIEVSGTGGGNQELQYYIKDRVAVEDGNLVLTAKREDYQGRAFTSGRINSNNKAAFKHGIMQARIKFPKTANGLWPAYWMMGDDIDKYGWPRCGEMDIVEMGFAQGIKDNTQDRYFGGTLHYGPSAANEDHQQLTDSYLAPEDNPVGDEWHIFTVEWDDTNLYMYYDLEGYGVRAKRNARYFSAGVSESTDAFNAGTYFQKPYYFLFNLAVGGTYTGIYNKDFITALPNNGDEAKMYVDWVRVYQKDDDNDAQYLFTDDNGGTQTNIPEDPEPEHQDDNKTVLSGFASEALDDNGVSTFNFDDCEDVVLISTSQGVTGNFQSRNAVLADYNVDEENHFMWVWDNTYVPAGTSHRTNSFGWEEGYNRFEVTSVGWSGLGFASDTNKQGKDLSMIDDSYWLHFAMKADDPDLHSSHTIGVGSAEFRVGETNGSQVSLGDFKRDGKWYYFDIPVKALLEMANPLFGSTANNYYGNAIAFLSGGVTGAELDFDNIFFYKSKTKTIPSYTDDSADLGKYGYKSLDENGKPVFDFAKAKNVTPLVLSQDVWEMITAGGTYDEETTIVTREHDLSEQGGKNNFFVWGDPQTFSVSAVTETKNSFGNEPWGGFSAYKSATSPGWNGAGWASIEGQGNYPTPKDLSHIDDSYSVHFSLRSDAAVAHVPVSIRFGSENGDAMLTFGQYSTNPIFADFNRDGEWYSFDIPVKVLKRYGNLWQEADQKGGINAYTDYVLCFNTMPTYYSGAAFSIDNVFFYQPTEAQDIDDDVNALGEWTTKSLDENDVSYFDFTGKKYIPVTMGAAERRAAGEENILDDFSINDQTTHFWIWDGHYDQITDGLPTVNSFGNAEQQSFALRANSGYSGAGIISDEGYNMAQITDKFKLHFAVRGTTANDLHLMMGKSHFTIGRTAYVNGNNELFPVMGNFERDGEWYSFDIPMSEFWKMAPSLWAGQGKAFKDNLFVFEATTGDEIHIDNIFFWISNDDFTIDSIEKPFANPNTSDSPVRYYDLSGREVKSIAAPGLYIIRTGNMAKKVMVK